MRVGGWGEERERVAFVFVFEQEAAYEIMPSLVGTRMFIRAEDGIRKPAVLGGPGAGMKGRE